MATTGDTVSKRVLECCRQNDSEASVASVLRDALGHTVIRLRPTEERTTVALLNTLRRVMPLAQCRMIENVLDGTMEAELVVPSSSDERSVAGQRARASAAARCLKWIALLSFAAGAALWAHALRGWVTGLKEEL